MNKYLVFDCESLGLHGLTFAVGYVVVDSEGTELESGIAVSSTAIKYIKRMLLAPKIISGMGEIIIEEYHREDLSYDDMLLVGDFEPPSLFKLKGNLDITSETIKWLNENVIPTLPEPTHEDIKEVRDWFWDIWMKWKSEEACLVSDCSWPVECNFLTECIKDDPDNREWNGPYPLLDVSSVLFTKGNNPVGTYDRKENELPVHNPLNDARQSARILIENLTLDK